ncbi:MAG: aspartate-semialdehyde dehydrogenase [Roseibacillus sp.]|nr:aspartate-semialdehyde dehydrogenase [Roseibacillus sp.]MDP7308854.1 aspartate-semialdehyde dehydrogenase [Roseibacillus sp.]MDP7655164.1 aspartate-semialdehyde dehydrogenase [Roseibacillus sp.]HJM65807.1 aspartate-semialdehyde dehydrogenase [Roseibacillus sp.]|tara:strand:- start:4450 stop:5454 length:1005 start_codon:yes stop_codon:yes gene_type:complete
MSHSPHVALAGATGAVGEEMLKCLEQRDFPVGELTLLASARSAGRKLRFRDREVTVQELGHDSFQGVDIALFSAGGSLSLEFGPSAAAAGAVVIDNSSAFRMDPEVPLVVPEVNPEAAKTRPKGIIANPNCTTIVTIMGLNPLHRKFGLKSVIASSYQAVSGSGQAGIMELSDQVRALSEGRNDFTRNVYPHQIAFNVIPHVDQFMDGGYTREELKMLNEGRKILELPDLQVTCTCVRVPVYRSHSVSVTAQFERPVSVEEARVAYEGCPGIRVVDDPANALYPTPLDTTEKDDCLVGRIREDMVLENALALWVVGDQVRKGAALNAVQIAELL